MSESSDREECHGVRQTLRRPRVGGVASVVVGNLLVYVRKRLPWDVHNVEQPYCAAVQTKSWGVSMVGNGHLNEPQLRPQRRVEIADWARQPIGAWEERLTSPAVTVSTSRQR